MNRKYFRNQEKKKGNPTICGNMGIMLSEISQAEKNKYYMISLTGGIKKYNKLVYITKRSQLTDIEKN